MLPKHRVREFHVERSVVVKQVIKEAERHMEKKLATIKSEIAGKGVSYTVTPSRTAPEFMRLLESLGLVVKVACINTDWWTQWGFSENATRQVVEAFQTELGGLRSSPRIHVNLDVDEEMERIREGAVDLAIVEVLISNPSRVMLYERNGIKALDPCTMHYSSSRAPHSQIVRVGTTINNKLKSWLPPRDLLCLRHDYRGRRLPTTFSDLGEELLWEGIVQNVRRDKSGLR